MFQKNLQPQSSGLDNKRSMKPVLLASCFMWVSGRPYYSTPKIEATCFSADFRRNAQHFIPESITLHDHLPGSQMLGKES
jgi:hypothetical protein